KIGRHMRKSQTTDVRGRMSEDGCRKPGSRAIIVQTPECNLTSDIRPLTSGIRPRRALMKIHRGCLALAGVLIALTAAPAGAGPVRVYITDSAGDTVHVIDAATNKVVQVIRGIEAPHGVTFSPDGARVYVSNESTNSLDVVDRKSGKVIKKVGLSGHPN